MTSINGDDNTIKSSGLLKPDKADKADKPDKPDKQDKPGKTENLFDGTVGADVDTLF